MTSTSSISPARVATTHGSEFDEPSSVTELGDHFGGHLKSSAGLSNASDTSEGDDARLTESLAGF